jgi:beta-phosphoglucomutase-like phosphatase (HAD superfamily)
VKPFYPSNQTVLPFKRNLRRYVEGVLVKSRYEEHRKSWMRLAAEREETPPPEMVLKHADTMKPEEFISRQLRWTRDPMEMRRINARRAEIYAEVMEESADKGVLELLPGVLPFLNLLRNNQVPTCVVCNTYTFSELCDVLKGLEIFEFFEHDTPGEPHVVSGEDVSDWLPDPRPIERSCQLMGRPPKRTVVFGNTTVVTEACYEAQAKSVLLLGRQPRYELQGADTVVGNLGELTVANLKRLFTVGLDAILLAVRYVQLVSRLGAIAPVCPSLRRTTLLLCVKTRFN